MRALAFPFLIAAPLFVAASAPAQPAGEPVDNELRRAQAEARQADIRARRLEQAARQAKDAAARLRARQMAAAEAIAAAEARISAADAERKLVAAQVALRQERLRRAQRPVASLLAGLAMMARRPPLLAIADEGSTEEFVRVRLLLDSTLPVIRRRTAALSAELREGLRLERAALDARDALIRSRQELAEERRRFSALEAEALRLAEARGGQALGMGDIALASGEKAERLAGEAAGATAARRLATELARLEPVPPRPLPPEGRSAAPPLEYALPAEAPIATGLGTVSASGIRSRGLTLATRRGAHLTVPASGTVRFSGPYRSHDGIIIIDHGRGWTSLIVNVASPLKPGAKVRIGEPLGRALGPIGLELSQNGRHVSPALIAGSSRNLSKGGKGG